MKRLTFILLFALLSLSTRSEEKQDSCYVYAQLKEYDDLFSYNVKITYSDFRKDITDSDGNKLKFKGFMSAVNHMSAEGWEVMQIYPYRYDQSDNNLTAILRKRVSIEEARALSAPNKKKGEKGKKDKAAKEAD